MATLKGHLLIAHPTLLDPNFHQTVVLLIEHSSDGAFGVVLNRVMKKSIQDVWEHFSDEPCQLEAALSVGGPVPGPLLALHRNSQASDIKVKAGLHCCTDREKILRLVRQAKEPIRFFVGCAGWGSGQLEGELSRGDWLTVEAKADHVFTAGASLWQELIDQLGDYSHRLGVKVLPPDPSLN